MPDQPAGRLVWLTQAQRNLISACATSFSPIISQPLDEIVDAFDAAPADPAEAVWNALPRLWLNTDRSLHNTHDAVLAALGCPPSEHTRDAS